MSFVGIVFFLQNLKREKQGVAPKVYSGTDPDYVTWVPPDGKGHFMLTGTAFDDVVLF